MSCGAVPVPGGRLTSAFGQRGPRFHEGIDIAAREGTPVRAVLPGVVIAVMRSGQWNLYGNTVVVNHGPRLGTRSLVSLSAHLASASVRVGDRVALGAELGTVGRTAGLKTDPSHVFDVSRAHLHLEFFDAQGAAWSLSAPRVDAGQVLAMLDIVAPPGAALRSACGPVELAELEPPRRYAAAAGGIGLLVAAYLAARYLT